MMKRGNGYISLLNELIRGARRTFHGPTIAKLKGQRNAIPVIGMEGEEIETDERRGKGVYERLRRVIAELHREKIFFGTSITVRRRNFALVTDAQRAEEAEVVLI